MVGVGPRHLLQMQGQLSLTGEGNPEFLEQLGVEVAHLLGGNLHLAIVAAPAGQVRRRQNQGFVHGQQGLAVAAYAPLVAQGLPEGVTQADAHVLHRVVVVHIGVAGAGQIQIEPAVPGKQHQHVVQKAAAGGAAALAGALQHKAQGNVGLGGGAFDLCRSHWAASFSISLTVFTNRSIWVSSPMVMRIKSRVRGASKCRTSTPFWRRA